MPVLSATEYQVILVVCNSDASLAHSLIVSTAFQLSLRWKRYLRKLALKEALQEMDLKCLKMRFGAVVYIASTKEKKMFRI